MALILLLVHKFKGMDLFHYGIQALGSNGFLLAFVKRAAAAHNFKQVGQICALLGKDYFATYLFLYLSDTFLYALVYLSAQLVVVKRRHVHTELACKRRQRL